MVKFYLALVISIFSLSSVPAFADDVSSGAMALLLSESDAVSVFDEDGTDLGTLSEMFLELARDLAQNVQTNNRCLASDRLDKITCVFSLSYSHLVLGDQRLDIRYIVHIKEGITVSVESTATLLNGGS